MTKGPIVRTITGLAVPIMASSLLGTLYNICDMAWVGTLGAKAVAGVGVGGMYIWLASGFAILPKMGGQVLTAQSIGAGDAEKAKRYARAAIQLVILFGMVFGALCLLFTRQLVNFFRLTDAESINTAVEYIRITCGAIVFTFLNMTLAGLYTADGDSKTPLKAHFCGLALNMVLDPLLIRGVWIFPMLGAVGAALATVIAQIIVTLILLIRMRKGKTSNGIFRGGNYLQCCSRDEYRKILKIGLPISLQSMAYCVISMILTRFVSTYGAEAVAVSRVGGQIESVSWNTADGFSSALNAFCGQNYGAKKYERIRKGYLFSIAATFAWGALVWLCFTLLPRQISGAFFHESAAIDISIAYLMIIGVSEPFLMAEIVTEGAMAGVGRTGLCGTVSILMSGLRIPLALLVQSAQLGLNGMWWVLTITSVLKGIVLPLIFLNLKTIQKRAA